MEHRMSLWTLYTPRGGIMLHSADQIYKMLHVRWKQFVPYALGATGASEFLQKLKVDFIITSRDTDFSIQLHCFKLQIYQIILIKLLLES